MEITVGGHYHLKRRIGAGSFGEVFYGEDVQTHEEVAIKLERVKTRVPQLLYESKIYLLFAGGINIPRLRWFGTESNFNVMVLDYLGKSLEDLFQLCHQQFSLKTVLMIAEQCLSGLQFIHQKTYIHRDIKPDNFLIGTDYRSRQIFVIDFGLSKRYKDPKTHQHIKYASNKSLTGTARYASINALKGYEQSRRDDLEALGYCFIYFMKNKLPWMGIEAKTRKEKYDKILDVKSSVSIEELCEGLPEEFAQYLTLVRDLRFNDDPDYSRYRALFRDLFIRKGYVYDYEYDWVSMFTKPKTSQTANNEQAIPKSSTLDQSNEAVISKEPSTDVSQPQQQHQSDNYISTEEEKNSAEKVTPATLGQVKEYSIDDKNAPAIQSIPQPKKMTQAPKQQESTGFKAQTGFKPPAAWSKPGNRSANPWGTKK